MSIKALKLIDHELDCIFHAPAMFAQNAESFEDQIWMLMHLRFMAVGGLPTSKNGEINPEYIRISNKYREAFDEFIRLEMPHATCGTVTQQVRDGGVTDSSVIMNNVATIMQKFVNKLRNEKT